MKEVTTKKSPMSHGVKLWIRFAKKISKRFFFYNKMYKLSIASTSNWKTGNGTAGNGTISITNLSAKTISNWSLHFTLSGMVIGTCWNVSFTKSGNNYTVFGDSWNKSLVVNQTIISGFSYTGTATFTLTTSDSNVIITPAPVPTPTPAPAPTPTPAPAPTPAPVPSPNNQRRVVYIGYWLNDANIPTIVSQLKNAGITHVLLTFIVQPDVTKPLTGINYMLGAFLTLKPESQKLLTSNFKVGVSLGGASEMPSPFSKTFVPTTSYYYNNPIKYAQDYYNLVKGTGLETYFDLDIEMINDHFPETADFIGNVCKTLKV